MSSAGALDEGVTHQPELARLVAWCAALSKRSTRVQALKLRFVENEPDSIAQRRMVVLPVHPERARVDLGKIDLAEPHERVRGGLRRIVDDAADRVQAE